MCLGDIQGARRVFEEIIAQDFRNFEAHFYLGQLLFERNDLSGALLEYTQLSQLAPERFEGHYNRAVVLSQLKQVDAAIEAFTRAIETTPAARKNQLAAAYVGLAGEQAAKGDFQGAATNYRHARELTPENPQFALLEAQSLYQGGNANKALSLASGLLNSKPVQATATILVAQIYAALELPGRAIRELERAIESAEVPHDRALLLVHRGLLLHATGSPDEGMASFTAAVHVDPNLWEAQYNLGISLLSTEPGKAIVHLKFAQGLRPSSAETLFALAVAQEVLHEYTAAYSTARNAERTSGGELQMQARFLAARCAYRNGQYLEAANTLRPLVARTEQAQALQAGQILQAEQLGNAQLWYGLSLLALKDFIGAINALERALTANPASAMIRVNLGAAHIAALHFEQAVSILRQAVADDPNNAEGLANLGIALIHLNKIAEARAMLLRALELGSSTASDALKALADQEQPHER